MARNELKERLMNKDDKNRHFVLLIIDISKHGAKEMGPNRHFAAHYRLFLN
jgi:hypothetical protein